MIKCANIPKTDNFYNFDEDGKKIAINTDILIDIICETLEMSGILHCTCV